jgi:CRISPR-associated protein (TIGR03984 family)
MNELICNDICTDLAIDGIETDLIKWLEEQAKWLEEQAKSHQLLYLLAHAEDGIIWGRFEVESFDLETSDRAFSECKFSCLRLSTLQQCRIFGEAGEVLLWNDRGVWRSRLILQSQVSELIAQQKIGLIPEPQILWGTQGKTNGNFTLLSDGSQGLQHAVPIAVEEGYFRKDKNELYRPVRLEVHHYFCYDSDGVARIFLSRLVSLKKEKI